MIYLVMRFSSESLLATENISPFFPFGKSLLELSRKKDRSQVVPSVPLVPAVLRNPV